MIFVQKLENSYNQMLHIHTSSKCTLPFFHTKSRSFGDLFSFVQRGITKYPDNQCFSLNSCLMNFFVTSNFPGISGITQIDGDITSS